MFELKHLSRSGIPGAFAKAERYRLLNQPWEAESIYLDVLQVDPDNQEALVGLVLALTDQFEPDGLRACSPRRARCCRASATTTSAPTTPGSSASAAPRRSSMGPSSGAGAMAYELLREAKGWYEQAEPLRPPGNDDVLLRWNACARLLMRFPQVAAAPEAIRADRIHASSRVGVVRGSRVHRGRSVTATA